MATTSNADLITRFYAAFSRRDAAAMAACYHAASTFSDPVFPDLDHAASLSMWRMLCERGKDLTVVASNVNAGAESGSVHWEATYTFSASGRLVINRIDAAFTFRDGLILRHEDRFSLYRWMRQALGLKGALVGWLPFAQNAVRAQAAASLAAWRAKNDR